MKNVADALIAISKFEIDISTSIVKVDLQAVSFNQINHILKTYSYRWRE